MVELLPRVKELDRLACRKWVEERFSADRMVENYLKVYEKIIQSHRREDHRPWGYYEILSDKPDHKVKRIVVYPEARLSLQRHFHRAEHWYILHGKALVTVDGKDLELSEGEAIDLPKKAWHRVKNIGRENLVFIEVQRGNYFGEDDIERKEDDYGRS